MTRPLLIPILSFLAGILAVNIVGIPEASGFSHAFITALSLILLSAAVCAILNIRHFTVTVYIFFFLLGAFRCTTALVPADNDISKFATGIPEKVVIYATVKADPEWTGASYSRRLVFPAECHRLLLGKDEMQVSGNIQVSMFTPGERAPQTGDELVMGGELSSPKGETNPAGFDYGKYLRYGGITAVFYSSGKDHYLKTGVSKSPVLILKRTIHKARDRAGAIVDKYLSGSSRAVTASVILGQRGDVTSRIKDVFAKTGTMHILAVSGLHIGIVAGVVLWLLTLAGVPRKPKYLITIIIMCAFAIFTGSRPSSVRAALMGTFLLLGLSIDRDKDILNALILSAFCITFFYPGQLFRAGFIFSYMAVLSIIFITPLTDSLLRIKTRTFKEGKPELIKRYLLKAVSVSFAIWIGMMPVIAKYFYIVTPSVVIANLVAIPALFVILILGFALVITGLTGILAPVSLIVAGALGYMIPWFIDVMGVLSRVPLSYVRVASPDITLVVLFYAVLGALIILARRTGREQLALVLSVLVAANIFTWNEALKMPPKAPRITVFDTGKADSSLVEFPDGSTMLIDGASGGKNIKPGAGENIIAPYLWQRGIRKIDCVVLTHPHEDHMGGLLYIVDNFKTGTVIDNGAEGYDFEAVLYKKFKGIINRKNIRYMQTERGDIIEGFPGTELLVFNPPAAELYGDPNNDSIVLKALFGSGFSMLFSADAGADAMKDMLRLGKLLASNVIKVPHHGGNVGEITTVEEFFKKVNPQAAIITNNDPQKIKKDIIETLRKNGTDIYVTGSSGAVVIHVEDGTYRIDTAGEE